MSGEKGESQDRGADKSHYVNASAAEPEPVNFVMALQQSGQLERMGKRAIRFILDKR